MAEYPLSDTLAKLRAKLGDDSAADAELLRLAREGLIPVKSGDRVEFDRLIERVADREVPRVGRGIDDTRVAEIAEGYRGEVHAKQIARAKRLLVADSMNEMRPVIEALANPTALRAKVANGELTEDEMETRLAANRAQLHSISKAYDKLIEGAVESMKLREMPGESAKSKSTRNAADVVGSALPLIGLASGIGAVPVALATAVTTLKTAAVRGTEEVWRKFKRSDVEGDIRAGKFTQLHPILQSADDAATVLPVADVAYDMLMNGDSPLKALTALGAIEKRTAELGWFGKIAAGVAAMGARGVRFALSGSQFGATGLVTKADALAAGLTKGVIKGTAARAAVHAPGSIYAFNMDRLTSGDPDHAMRATIDALAFLLSARSGQSQGSTQGYVGKSAAEAATGASVTVALGVEDPITGEHRVRYVDRDCRIGHAVRACCQWRATPRTSRLAFAAEADVR